jgi:hypothetical protein
VNNLTLDYDFNAGSWWAHTNAANQWAKWRPSSGLELYAAQAAAAIVDKSYVPGTTQDNGANFTAYWRSPWITFRSRMCASACADAHGRPRRRRRVPLIKSDVFTYSGATIDVRRGRGVRRRRDLRRHADWSPSG